MDADTQREDARGLWLLAEPVRRRLYDFVAGQHAPVTREEAASATDTSRNLAAYHLDKLAEAGLLDISYARKRGRTGPGSGRPAKRYARSGRELTVSFPPRNYSLLAQILADAADAPGITDAGPLRASLARSAENAGRALGARAHDLPAALSAAGYEPAVTGDGDVVLHNCPFHSIAQDHVELVCALNHATIRGALTGAGDDPDRAELSPCPGRCCVVIRPSAHR